MNGLRPRVPSARTIAHRGLMLALALALTGLTPLAAGEFPATVTFEGSILDAAGLPLEGTYDLTLRYLDAGGDELLVESQDGVAVARGRLEIELGTGRIAQGGQYASLRAAFAVHPEVRLEVAIDGTVQEPEIGILPAGHSLESRLVAAGVRAAADGKAHWEGYEARGGATSVQAAVLAPAGSRAVAPDREATVRRRPYTLPVVGPMLSRPVRDLPLAVERPMSEEGTEINAPRHEALYDEKGNRFGTIAPKVDDYLAGRVAPPTETPSVSLQFEGINNVNGVLPPDTEGAVGPNHYVQVVNLSFAVYNKVGTKLTGPSNTNTLWAGFGGPCQTDNSGDAIFLYDQQADRFVLTQFAVSGSHQSVCFAVSQTPDPTGSYYLYEVVTPRFPDYYKVGVWPAANNNAYFFGTNSGFQGQYDVFAVDRSRMLTGSTARSMQFFQNFSNLMMPADVDGPTGPAASSAGIFYTFRDGGEPYFGSPPSDSLDIWEFHVDWNTPSNSTITQVNSITPAQGLANFNWTVCGFFVSNCIPQPGTSQGIDSASWWPMQRLVYRDFGSHETLVGAWTVDVNSSGNRAAPRWFELRDTGGGWTLYQQGTQSPDAIHRWMPSVAMDGSGNIAIGYSRGNGSNFPSIYYATREAGDPLDTMQPEALMFAGTGSQTHSAARWGDYASMELDPADDCTFWFTTEYLATTSSASWRTRIGSFSIPGCGGPPVPDFSVSCTPSSHSIQQGANAVSTCTVSSTNGFASAVALSCSGQPAGISCGFVPSSVTPPAGGSANSTLTLSVGGGQGTGTFAFDVEGSSGGNTRTSPMTVTVTPEGSNGPQNAVFNATYQAPACLVAGSSCDTQSLVNGRANLGPEPNQPNTIYDSCADGTSGTYHSDESNDRIVVSTLDGGNFSEGDTVRIDATLWAWSTGSSDTLDLYYAADATSPSWTYLTSIVPPAGGAQTLSAQYTLPNGTLQAVRAAFRYQGSANPCVSGAYNDRDDLIFAVEGGTPNTAPTVTITAPANGSSFVQGSNVTFSGTAMDAEDGTISGSLSWTSSLDGAIGSGASFSTTSLSVGTHTITASVTDSGGLSDSDAISVTITSPANTPPTVTITSPLSGSSFVQGSNVAFSGTATDAEDGTISGSLSWTSSLDGAIGSGASFSTTSLSVGTHTITASVTDSGGLSDSDAISITITPPVGGGSAVWMSFKTNTAVPGVGTVADEDIVSYDEVTGLWTLQFDGSDVGLAALEISGLAILPGGDLLLTFTAAGTVGGLSVDDSDIVRFHPTSLGSTTAGTFSVYFDGSDVGLTTNGEDVDAIALAPDGRLLISTTGTVNANGVSAVDEDLLIFTGTLGSNTSGSFALYFDGSDVGLNTSSSEDVDGAAMTASGSLLFATVGNFSVSGASGANEDVGQFTGTFGSTTSGSFSLRLDLSTLGIDTSEAIGSLHIVD
jgi:Bacterial Ig domain